MSESLRLAIRPHAKAPLFTLESNPELVLQQVALEVNGGNYPTSEAYLELLRQAGFVSLWFFLKYIASYNGPYDKLNETLHLDMANFRQSDACMLPGARSAMLVFRGGYKSSIGGHGANTWEALRNPDIAIRIVSNVIDRASDFKGLSQRTFDSNALFKACYPEYVPPRSQLRWNENEFVLPNRARHRAEPTVSVGGATGAAEGVHVDVLNLDDIEGLDDIDSLHKANANMYAKKKWFNTNTTALLVDKSSRIHVNGTFYGADDLHSEIISDAKRICGYKDPDFPENPLGHWTVYYRSWKETQPDGEELVVFPEVMDQERYDDLLRRDPWSAIIQYRNKNFDPATAELSHMETKRFKLHYSEKLKQFVLVRGPVAPDDENFFDEPDGALVVALSACDCVMTVDPAGTEEGMTAKTSRSAVLVVAEDAEENVYVLWSRVGYFSTSKLFDCIFEGCDYFEGAVRGVFVESNAMQKIIAPLLRKEQLLRGKYINPQPVAAKGNKEGRVRLGVGRVLMRNKLWLEVNAATEIEEERKIFPGRMDALDALEKALTALSKPSPEEELESEDYEDAYAVLGRNTITGYRWRKPRGAGNLLPDQRETRLTRLQEE